MLFIDIFKVHLNIAAPGTSNDIFPMGHRETGSIFKGNMSPDLRLLPKAKQADGAAHQNRHRQNWKQETQYRGHKRPMARHSYGISFTVAKKSPIGFSFPMIVS